MKSIVSLLFLLLLFVCAIVIGSQNEQVITVNYILAQAHLRVSTFLAICLGLGILVGLIAFIPAWLGLKLRVKRLDTQLKKLSQDH